MGVINAREARVTDWTTRSVGAIWRAFDLQLVTYAILLTCFGLAMAYSNAVAGGDGALTSGSVFLRGLLWTGIALIVFTVAAAFDYHWLKTLSWPIYALQLGLLGLTLAVGTGVGGSSRWVSVLGLQFQFSELAKILMIVVLANYLGARRGRLDSIWSILGACILAEELGFIGAIVVLGLFIALLWRVLVTGWRSKDPFGTLFAAGLGSMLLFQLFVNVGMVTGIMPITGIPLPFITHGGASLISIAAGLGILESINIRQGRAEW